MEVEKKENPFRVPENYVEASSLFIFNTKLTRPVNGSINKQVLLYRDVTVLKQTYDEYMLLIVEYCKSYERLQLMYDIGKASDTEISNAFDNQVAAHDDIVDFVERYQPYYQEEQLQPQPQPQRDMGGDGVMDVEADERVRQRMDYFSQIPCEVVAYMTAREILDPRAFKEIGDAMQFLMTLMNTNKTIMGCLFSGTADDIWRAMIERFYDGFRFVSIDSLEKDFFTKKFLGTSPLLELTDVASDTEDSRWYLRRQIKTHMQPNIDPNMTGSEAHMVFMYMLLWHKDFKGPRARNQLTMNEANSAWFYDSFRIWRATKRPLTNGAVEHNHAGLITEISVLQQNNVSGATRFYVDTVSFDIGQRIVSVIPFAYFSGTTYTKRQHTTVMLLINNAYILHKTADLLESNGITTWTLSSNLSELYPVLKYCRATGERDITIYKLTQNDATPRSDPHSYLRAYMACMQPIVVPGVDKKGNKVSTIGVVDFRPIIEALVAGTKATENSHRGVRKMSVSRSMPSKLTIVNIHSKVKGHVLAARLYAIYIETIDPSGKDIWTSTFRIAMCTYRKKWLHLYASDIRVLSDQDTKMKATKNAHKVLAVKSDDDERHFLNYDYHLWPLFDNRGIFRILTADYRVMACSSFSRKGADLDTLEPTIRYSMAPVTSNNREITLSITPVTGVVIMHARITTQTAERLRVRDFVEHAHVVYTITTNLSDLVGDMKIVYRMGRQDDRDPEQTPSRSQLRYVMTKTNQPGEVDFARRDKSEHWSGIRIIMSSVSRKRIVFYSNSAPSQEDSVFLGQSIHRCTVCAATADLAQELSHTQRIFCRIGTCQQRFYNACTR